MDATTVSEQVEEVIQADRENEKISLVADAHAEAVATEAEQNVSKKTTQEESFPKQTSTIHTTDFLSSFPSSVADGLITKPFREPLQNCKPQPRPELTSDQAQKYSKFLEFVSSLSGLPVSSKPNAPCTPLSDNERMWLTRECLLRYLRATKWNVTAASERIKSTLIWRRENIGEDKLSPDYISPENEMGKHLVLGWDIHGRPCFYLIPRHECTDKGRRQVEHLIFMLERAIDLLPAGQDTIALVADFASVSRKQAATVSQTREILDFLQNHYPETLGRALAINMPLMVTIFFRLISPFIDPTTKEKLRWNEDLRQHIPPEQLVQFAGGDVKWEYDHSIYWAALNQLTEHRRKAYRERWVQSGSKIGESEDYLRGGL